MPSLVEIGPVVPEKKIFEGFLSLKMVDDGRRTDDGRTDGRRSMGIL